MKLRYISAVVVLALAMVGAASAQNNAAALEAVLKKMDAAGGSSWSDRARW